MDSPVVELARRRRERTAEPDRAVDTLDAILDDSHPVVQDVAAWAADHAEILDTGVSPESWRLLADAGFQSIVTPTELGGLGLSAVDAMLAYEGLGLGCHDNGLVFALSSQVFAMQSALRSGGSADQLTTWLPGLLDGSAIGAFAMTEPDAGSDSSAIRTTARRVDAHADDPHHPDARYELTGEKCWITLGPAADVVVVFATTDPTLGKWGITAFAVETSRPGVDVGPDIPKVGLHSSLFGTVHFDGCEVGSADRLGPEGAGGSIFTKAVEGERAFLFAGQLGATRRTLDAAIHAVRAGVDRRAEPGSNQAVEHRVADMALDLEMARLLVYKAAALHDRGASVGMAAAFAKLQTSEMAVATAFDAMNLHGIAAHSPNGVGREAYDALGGLAYSGTSDIQRMIVARLLRVDAPLRRQRASRDRSSAPGKTAQPSVRPTRPAATKNSLPSGSLSSATSAIGSDVVAPSIGDTP